MTAPLLFRQAGITEKSTAENLNRVPFAVEHLQDVPQIPADVHRVFAVYGDDLGDRRLTADQANSFHEAIRQAAAKLRAAHDQQQKEKETWENMDVTKFLTPEKPAPTGPVQIFGPIQGSGNFTRGRGRPRRFA